MLIPVALLSMICLAQTLLSAKDRPISQIMYHIVYMYYLIYRPPELRVQNQGGHYS